jgi:hypothetical protein
MKASRFTGAQNPFIIMKGEEGKTVATIRREAGFSQETNYD